MNHDEYTDYSCSTSIERLARDVETLLRSWHVTGSDRHVSFDHSHNPRHNLKRRPSLPNLAATETDQDEKSNSPESPPRNFRGLLQRTRSLGSPIRPPPPPPGTPTRAVSSPSRGLSRSSSFRPKRVTEERQEVQESTSGVRLIRSETVTWTVSLAEGGKVAVPLTLALWDGPSRPDAETDSDLPHSLRRLAFTTMPDDPFSNFCTLFGIGQHLSLSPTLLNPDLTMSLAASVLTRHSKKTTPWVVSSILSSSLQMALNVAVSNVQSRLPVFGIWGIYSPSENVLKMQQHNMVLDLYPNWASPSSQLPSHAIKSRMRLFSSKSSSRNRGDNIPPLVSGNILPSQYEMDSPTATFWVSVLPRHHMGNDCRLSVWGQLLLRHCPSSDSVVLRGARHVYVWQKQQVKFPRSSALFGNVDTISKWRNGDGGKDAVMNDDELASPNESVETYRRECRRYAEKLLEKASGATPTEPRWGPLDDPVASIYVTATWNGRTNEAEGTVEPLISLPFVVRSRHKMTQSDWIDMEDSVEKTLLDPFDPSQFVVQTHYDKDTSVTPLAASQRCILAALIRTATLPPEILMQHVTNEAVMDGWSTEMGEQAAKELVELANLHPRTKQLVEAMDWTSIADDMIESWEAEQIVENVFDGSLVLGFPSPPEESFAATADDKNDRGMFAPFPKSAPPGRLLSLLFLNMSRLHAPSSMALVWKNFVSELRTRWDMREALPNMSYVPGLDPSPEDLNVMRCVTTIGLKADHAAFVNCSEPDPDDTNCLVGQKLQVFNIGIESAVALEIQEVERAERLHQEETAQEEIVFVADPSERKTATASVASTSTEVINNATGEGLEGDVKKPIPVVDTLPNKREFSAIAESPEGEQFSHSRDSTSKDEFHDAQEGLSLRGSTTDDDSAEGRMDITTSVTQRQNRMGARCPVHGVGLVASRDQLYAPYLQRSAPVTDDVILERRKMLSKQRGPKSPKLKVHDRIEIAHRLQKPKLLSDMRSFKAANPGAVFADFINWYGNPGNPLDEYGEEHSASTTSAKSQPGESILSSTAVKLDNASEAIQILTAMRDFWSEMWDAATPCPAAEQEPLFDASTAVEMILDGFETMHPASLVNQIMAVNLSSAYFTLVSSAGDTLQVGMVTSALKQLRDTTERALLLLSRDVTFGTSRWNDPVDNIDRLPRHASLEAIRACDAACNALGIAEVSIARAMSILHKFPQQYDFVQKTLCCADGEPIALESSKGRSSILHAIHNYQETQDTHPVPCLREYILRNTDECNPCQLCVRFGQGGSLEGDNGDDGVVLAVTKCYRD